MGSGQSFASERYTHQLVYLGFRPGKGGQFTRVRGQSIKYRTRTRTYFITLISVSLVIIIPFILGYFILVFFVILGIDLVIFLKKMSTTTWF